MAGDWRDWQFEEWSAWRRRGWGLPSAKPSKRGARKPLVSSSCEHDEWLPDAPPDSEAGYGAQIWNTLSKLGRGTLVRERGARIRDDEAGLVYEVTIGSGQGSVWVTGLTVLALDAEQGLSRESLRAIPLERLASLTAQYLAGLDSRPAPPDGVLRIGTSSRAPRAPGERPTDAELIADVQLLGMRRPQIAAKYDRPLSTVDNWLRDLRHRGAIPPGKPGRPARRKEDG